MHAHFQIFGSHRWVRGSFVVFVHSVTLGRQYFKCSFAVEDLPKPIHSFNFDGITFCFSVKNRAFITRVADATDADFVL